MFFLIFKERGFNSRLPGTTEYSYNSTIQSKKIYFPGNSLDETDLVFLAKPRNVVPFCLFEQIIKYEQTIYI